MLKLTDPNYFLPVVHALQAGRILNTGRTKPMIVLGLCEQNQVKGEYVVKLRSGEHMWVGSCLNELLASFIAAELGFQVPTPALVHISPEFIETMQGHGNYNPAAKSLGFNFASELRDGYQEVVPGQLLPKGLEKQMLEMFAFDLFLGNVDRRHDKPNFLSNGKSLLLLDHELAFDFMVAIFKNPEPWIIRPIDMPSIENDFCYRQLKGKSFDFSDFTAKLSVLDGMFWKKARQIIPTDWQTDRFAQIQEHLDKIIGHGQEFALELNRILS